MGLNPVSSSGKAVYEYEMGLNPVSSAGKAVYEDEMDRGFGHEHAHICARFEVPMGVGAVPEIVEGPTAARHSGLAFPSFRA